MDQEQLDIMVQEIVNFVRKEMAPLKERLEKLEGQQSEKQKADHAKRLRVVAEIKQSKRVATVKAIKVKQHMARLMEESDARRIAAGLPLPVVRTR